MESVPEVVRQAALHAFDLRIPGARIADLVYDPLLDDDQRLPASETDRVLQFQAGDDGATVVVTPRQGSLRLTVALKPAQAAAVELKTTTDSWALSADDTGRLRVEGVPPGLVSLVVRRPRERPMQTAWVRL